MAARELSRLGIDALHRGSLPEAHARFAAALKTNSDDAESRYQLSRVLWRQGHTERAIEEMDVAIQATSDGNPGWTVELGKMLLAQSEFEGALECSRRALQGSNELPSAWRLQAEVFQATGRMNEALQAYHQAVATGDSSADALVQIASIYRGQGRARRALSTLQRLEDQLPADQHPKELEYWQGLALQAMGRHEDAIEQFVASKHKMGEDTNLLASLKSSRVAVGDGPQKIATETEGAMAANFDTATKMTRLVTHHAERLPSSAHETVGKEVHVRSQQDRYN